MNMIRQNNGKLKDLIKKYKIEVKKKENASFWNNIKIRRMNNIENNEKSTLVKKFRKINEINQKALFKRKTLCEMFKQIDQNNDLKESLIDLNINNLNQMYQDMN